MGLMATASATTVPLAAAEQTLSLSVFIADVTPPIGSPLCHGLVMPAKEIVDRLTARGIILYGAGKPIVLCAFDWVGIANESYDLFRQTIAKAAKTDIDRVMVHSLHQHDAPGVDIAAEKLLAQHGLAGVMSDPKFEEETLRRLTVAIQNGTNPKRVTHIGTGEALVEKVASNRRVLGPDGKVAIVRYSSMTDPKAIAAPEGVIDPKVKLISFWNGDKPVTAMTFYATHPQSYYGKGGVSCDFVGLGRNLFERGLPSVPVIHFDGAGGNIAAGKYNDGSPGNRPVLARRLADGMKRAWDSQKKTAIKPSDVRLAVAHTNLPARATMKDAELLAKLQDKKLGEKERVAAARDLIWLRRTSAGNTIPISGLHLGEARAVFLPGELFVEYQLEAQKLGQGKFVATAAYGDYGPGYIGTVVSYSQGGYETSAVSLVDERTEPILLGAIKKVLGE
jgi:hypothetical protein